jgi:uncharacterized membrane protein
MNIKLYTFWEQLSRSFWFLPILMVLAAIGLALLLPAVDQSIPLTPELTLAWFYTGSPDGARSLLSTIAGSMISVAGITFSITMATLSLASSQLGPRLLNNFMRDRGNQFVLGTFVAVFIYCLLVLRTIRSTDEVSFVPHVSVTLAMLMTVGSLGVLIYFFHHVSMMIQSQNVITNIGRELEANIERLFSRRPETAPYEYELREEDDVPADFDDNRAFVAVDTSGYLQAVDYEALQKTASEHDLLLRVLYRPGDFIAKGSKIVAVYPEAGLSDAITDAIRAALTLGAERLYIQDVEYAIEQLVEIAVRALSPGINDPFTAIACLDQFSTTLADLAQRTIPSGYFYDAEGHLRVIRDVVTFEGIVNAAFDQIRQHGKSDVAVTIRLLEVIAIIVARTQTAAQRRALIRQAEMIKRTSEAMDFDENDRRDIAERYSLVLSVRDNEETPTDV